MDVMKEEGNVMVGVIVCRLRRQGQHRQSMDDLRLPRGQSGSPHLTSPHTDKSPVHLVEYSLEISKVGILF